MAKADFARSPHQAHSAGSPICRYGRATGLIGVMVFMRHSLRWGLDHTGCSRSAIAYSGSPYRMRGAAPGRPFRGWWPSRPVAGENSSPARGSLIDKEKKLVRRPIHLESAVKVHSLAVPVIVEVSALDCVLGAVGIEQADALTLRPADALVDDAV
jgi:hypothetical protein